MRSYVNPAADQWYLQVTQNCENFPFSFTYRGTRYNGFSPALFTPVSHTVNTSTNKQVDCFVWQLDEQLTVTLHSSHHFSHGASEWTVWFENTSAENSGILEDPHCTLSFTGAYPVLKGILGDGPSQYRPYAQDLLSGPVHFETNSGRATHTRFPYFNLEHGDCGTMLAIGWAGTWCADFRVDDGIINCTTRGVNGLRTYLKPGEKIRTPLFVRASYSVREENYVTNYWRSFFINCNMPKQDATGADIAPFSTNCFAFDTGLPNSDGSISERHTTWKPTIDKMLAEGLKVDYRWFDAGWYSAPDGSSPEEDWWGTIGTWELDPAKWPGDTFRQSTDYAREHGMKTLMWFEPERITDPENLAKYHGYDVRWAIRCPGQTAISNNIGDPDCFRWTVDRIKKTLTENRVEMYREDNNCNPAKLWLHLDAQEGENRTGITECKFIDAHYRMWDEFIACTLSYGGCGFVDSCASGGGRNDLESMRRGIPLLRSDSDRTTSALRLSMTSSFCKWIPFCGALTREKVGELDPQGTCDPYVWRASYLPSLNVETQFVYHPTQDFSMIRFGIREWSKINAYLLKDFYTLTPWHSAQDNFGFTAMCYHDEEENKGILLAFRQERCMEEDCNVTLPFVAKEQMCTFTDEDTGETVTISGKEMVTNGLTLSFPEARSARLLCYSIT